MEAGGRTSVVLVYRQSARLSDIEGEGQRMSRRYPLAPLKRVASLEHCGSDMRAHHAAIDEFVLVARLRAND